MPSRIAWCVITHLHFSAGVVGPQLHKFVLLLEYVFWYPSALSVAMDGDLSLLAACGNPECIRFANLPHATCCGACLRSEGHTRECADRQRCLRTIILRTCCARAALSTIIMGHVARMGGLRTEDEDEDCLNNGKGKDKGKGKGKARASTKGKGKGKGNGKDTGKANGKGKGAAHLLTSWTTNEGIRD